MTEAVRIRAIAAGGDGVGAMADGRAVFIPRTAPEDLVEPASVKFAKRFARARIGRLLTPSPVRIVPRCPHYDGDDCGGCQLQHVTPAGQREARSRIVSDALARIGGLPVPPPALVPSERDWEYRAKISLTAKGRRIGYHRVGRPDQVFDLVRCHIARPEISRLWDGLRANRRLLPPNLDRLVLRVDREGGRHAFVHVTGTLVWTGAAALGRELEKAGTPAVLWWHPEGGAARALYGAAQAYPAMVFEQVHPEMGDQVRAHAVAALGEVRARHVWDLYAGVGETTRALLERGATVESVEIDRRAVELAESRGPAGNVQRHAGRVEDVFDKLRPAETVIVNPPRTGLGEAVTDRLSARPPLRLVYVSCDPATLARDLARLAPACRVTRVTAFDLFPQTAHVETVVEAVRA
jgi:23S rRNA (uracil1939-C5)-methyltransferase